MSVPESNRISQNYLYSTSLHIRTHSDLIVTYKHKMQNTSAIYKLARYGALCSEGTFLHSFVICFALSLQSSKQVNNVTTL